MIFFRSFLLPQDDVSVNEWTDNTCKGDDKWVIKKGRPSLDVPFREETCYMIESILKEFSMFYVCYESDKNLSLK